MWASVFYLIACFCLIEVPAVQRRSQSNSVKGQEHGTGSKKRLLPRPRWHAANKKSLRQYESCWLTLNAPEHFKTMETLEKKYADVRKDFDEKQYYDKFDEEILGTLLSDRGATYRETQKHGNKKSLIPSGLNLGGYSMMRMSDSIMFFHRMKLRNDTRFRVNYLSSDFTDMTLTGRLDLNDLHLIGTYERSQTTPDAPSELFYTPSYGEVEILLRNVLYKMEGRYRLQKDRLFLEVIISSLYIPVEGIIMTYRNANSTNTEEEKSLQTKHISDFLDRLKTDLDLWLRDFFNEFFLNHPLTSFSSQEAFLNYDKERIIALNRYVDDTIKYLIHRMEELNADDGVKLPSFTIYTFNGFVLQISDGTLTGLNTMYRRSMATNKMEIDVRKVDALIAFSSLKVRYSYEVKLTAGTPPLYGSLILTADELSAIMSLWVVKDPPFVDMNIDFIQQLKPESLTVEGSVGGVIANFKHVLELHIIAIMTNAMVDQVHQLKSLVACVPSLLPIILDEQSDSDDGNKNQTKLHNKKKKAKKNVVRPKSNKNGKLNLNIRPATQTRRRRPTKRSTDVDNNSDNIEENDDTTAVDAEDKDTDIASTTTNAVDDVDDTQTTIEQPNMDVSKR